MTDTGLRTAERKAVDETDVLRSPAIYEVVRRQGLEELRRTVASLWWSGVAGGLALSMSLYCQGFLHVHLPDTPWRHLITSFGYCIGFLIVILGRLQLFTENTIRVILPLLAAPTAARFGEVARLWLVVLAANLTGTFASALLAVYGGASAAHLESFIAVADAYAAREPAETFLYGIPGGFLIASLVWILPNAEGAKPLIVVALTYMIAAGELTHVIVGATDVSLLVLTDRMPLMEGLTEQLLPAFAGNVIGGTGLFALIAYGQVRDEL